ncbi:hypothetical protein BGZ83_008175 [Gryganskiella cystojenkinii]|nr:hypothetical protein BGZ83_008175 [Gryganskiella cystojenkinii]
MNLALFALVVALTITLLDPSVAAVDPVQFQNIMLAEGYGCRTAKYTPSCDNITSMTYPRCTYLASSIDMAPKVEHCVFHPSGLNLTTCFIFSKGVQKEDFNYLLEQTLFFKNIFGFRSTTGNENSARGWAKGFIWTKAFTYYTYYAVSIAAGSHATLNTTLPPMPLIWPANRTSTLTPIKAAC